MADKLGVWNQALIHLEDSPITSLTDSVKSVRVFGNAWTGVVEEAFNEGDWNFAKEVTELSQSGTPSSGYTYSFTYPTDYERTIAINPDPEFDAPFLGYKELGGVINSNIAPLFIKYISTDKMADAEVTNWPTMFWRFVAVKLAYDTCGRITQGSSLEDRLERKLRKALIKAKSVDARNEEGSVIKEGSWLRARRGGAGKGGGTRVQGYFDIPLTEGDV